jgi:hypothetical protein
MSKISLSFEAENENELLQLVLSYAFKQKKPPSWLGQPLDAEAMQAEAQAREAFGKFDDEDDAKQSFPDGNGEDLAPPPSAPEPAKRARAARAPRVPAPAPAPPAPTAAPPVPPVDLPPLDTLKSIITSAVRLAQKGEGSKKVLDLLPAFKDTTGLTFVMNAEDKHRAALYDLVQAAGLPVV